MSPALQSRQSTQPEFKMHVTTSNLSRGATGRPRHSRLVRSGLSREGLWPGSRQSCLCPWICSGGDDSFSPAKWSSLFSERNKKYRLEMRSFAFYEPIRAVLPARSLPPLLSFCSALARTCGFAAISWVKMSEGLDLICALLRIPMFFL